MKIEVFFLIPLLITGPTFAQQRDEEKKEKVIYKYKKYEKFDFDQISIKGEGGSPGDLSITPRSQRGFKNKLPFKKDFNPEIRKSIERVR